jgi:hypothetical protein
MIPASRARLQGLVEQWRANFDPDSGDYLSGPENAWLICADELAACLAAEPQQTPEPVNAHTLTLEFGRFLSEAEWREIVTLARQWPHVRSLQANAVAACLAAEGEEPSNET